MLMTMRAFNEAARALVLWTALKSDVAHRSGDAKERQAADDHMGLMTPVIKGVLTDQGFANTVMAQQVFGGHGYIAEHGMEQFVRDARIAMIYEGANGIQALDLVGRKLPQGRRPRAAGVLRRGVGLHQGPRRRRRPWRPTSSRSARRSANCSRRPCGSCRTRSAIRTMPAPARPITCISSVWSRSATCGASSPRRRKPRRRPAATAPPTRMAAKLATGRFFMERLLPAATTHLARIKAGAASTMALPAEAF